MLDSSFVGAPVGEYHQLSGKLWANVLGSVWKAQAEGAKISCNRRPGLGLLGGNQLDFSACELTTAKIRTKSDKFVAEIEAVVPRQGMIDLIDPHYPKTSMKGGWPPYPLPTMLRIYLP